MAWDKNAAVKWAKEHALNHSIRKCAHYVSNAIRQGGVNIPNTHYAKDMGITLLYAGFHEVDVNQEPMPGDIAVIQAENAEHFEGHVCIYGGNGIWYSDFVQRHGMYPGPGYRRLRPSFKIYRH